MSSDHARIAAAIDLLAAKWDAPPSLAETAKFVGLSQFHFQRVFRRMTGVSPKRFCQALGADRGERLLRRQTSTLRAAQEMGLSSPGRLHDLMVNVRAMTPGEIKNGGAGLTLRYGVHETPFGECLVVLTARGICELSFVDSAESLDERWPRATLEHSPDATAQVVAKVLSASDKPGPVTLHVSGTNFQLRVWKALLAIPYGETATYADVASAVGQPGAARAVGGAVARNPVALLIPCHRVLRSHGALGGYRWSVPRKRAILAWEAARGRETDAR